MDCGFRMPRLSRVHASPSYSIGQANRQRGKFSFGMFHFAQISVFSQPKANLLGSLLMVDLGYDEWPRTRQKVYAAAQDFVLAAFHVNLDQLWYGSAGSDEVVQTDGWHSYDFACSHHRILSVQFHSTLGSSCSSAAERDPLTRGVGPHSGVHNFKACLQMVPRNTFP